MNPAWPFGELKPHSYDLIMADPPWETALHSAKGYKKSPESHYNTMSIEEIAALPLHRLASKDCILFLWGRWDMLFEGMFNRRDPSQPPRPSFSPIGRVIEGFGFVACTGGAWVKQTKNGKLTMGTGYRVRGSTEPWFICTLGAPATSKGSRNCILTEELIAEIEQDNAIGALRRKHSQKPPDAYEWCERYFPTAMRRLDLFSRETQQGWDAWGDQTGLLDQHGGA